MLAKFEDIGIFDGAKFEGETVFVDAEFKDGRFSKASFQEVNFSGAHFLNFADFSQAKFFRRTYFGDRISTSDKNIKSIFDADTIFSYAIFEGAEKINFKVENLSNVSFAYTDITRVTFEGDIRWGESESGESKFKLKDERELEKAIKYSKSLELLLKTGKVIKKNKKPNIIRFDDKDYFRVNWKTLTASLELDKGRKTYLFDVKMGKKNNPDLSKH